MSDTNPKQGFIVVENAKLNCSLGAIPNVSLTVNHKEDNKYLVNNKKIATWLEDKKDHMNFGTCKRSDKNPACTPNISWSDYYENTEFGKQKILIDKSKGFCKKGGGTVTINNHGQTAQPSSRIYKNDIKESYEIFMLSPQIAATKGKKSPSVSKIDLLLPIQTIPVNREIQFEIGGNIKNITLVATVGNSDDKSLVNWVVYKGVNQKDRIKTYLEHGSIFILQLDSLPEGKSTIFGYGKTPIGDSTKIIINRKHNKLEGISMKSPQGLSLEAANMVSKKTQIIFVPKYTFQDSPKLSIDPNNLKQKVKWTIKDKNNNILYSSAPSFSPTRDGIISASSKDNNLNAVFFNSETYMIELEDTTLGSLDKKNLPIQVKSRSANKIVIKGAEKIRKEDLIHLEASEIKFDYGIGGLGNQAFWHVQKDSGSTISLGLKADVQMKVSQLIEFMNHQIQINDPYGNYKFRIDGEEKDVISIGSGSDTAVIEVAKNRMESISGPDKIPVGAIVTYKTQTLMSLVTGETIRWIRPVAPFIKFKPYPDNKVTLQLEQPGTASFSTYLEGKEVSSIPVNKTVKASYISLKKALWCYNNGKRRAETGWEEESYIHISLEGIINTPVKIKIWVQHPDSDKTETLSVSECLLKEIDASLNEKGSLQVSFVADKEIKEKIQKFYPKENSQARMFFTLEFTAGEVIDLSKVELVHKENSKDIPSVEKQGKILYFVLDSDEDLKIPADPRITAINFSNEAADDIQVGLTQYGKKHTIWVNTVGMLKEKLVVIVYKQLLKDDMKETYNNKKKAFAVTAQVKKYDAQEVGADGLLALDFTPEKKDADGDPQMFYIAVFKEQKNDKNETKLVEIGSQLKSLDSLPFDKELNKDASQVGIVMPTLEEGQNPTADQLKDIVSKFLHFYNPLYVSETGIIENQEIISPALVERGDNKKTKTCYCDRDFTEDEIRSLVKTMKGKEVIWEGIKSNACIIKDKTFKSLTIELNKMFRKFKINKCIQKITFLAQVNAETGFFAISHEIPSPYASSKYFYKGRGLIQLTGSQIKDNNGKIHDIPGPYKNYGVFLKNENIFLKNENIFIKNPDLIATDLHYTVDSSGWEWENEKRVPNWNPDKYKDKDIKLKEAIKWKVKTFSKGLGKSLNQLALVMEESGEEENYFWLQSKILNGYSPGHKDKPDPHGWEKRKEGLRKLKTWFKYDKAVCRGGKELELEEEGVLAKMKRLVDNHYEYKQETDQYRTEVSEAGLKFMDCSELVSRYLFELEIGINKSKNEPIYMTTANMTTQIAFRKKLGNDNIDLVGKEVSFKPQRGDIFAWGYSGKNGWNGHTGIVYNYDEIKDLVTILEAIGLSGSADESQNTIANGGFTGKGQTRTSVYKLNSKALVNHKGWFGYYRPKNYTKIL